MTMNNKRAYDFKCNTPCRTKSRNELEEQFGEVNSTIHGYEFGKTCKFPIKIAEKLFYGCIWSDLSGPWCYTDVQKVEKHVIGYYTSSIFINESPVSGKWGICSNNCPIEECPLCEFPFRYLRKNYESCKQYGNSISGTDFYNMTWCYNNQTSRDWKFCLNPAAEKHIVDRWRLLDKMYLIIHCTETSNSS